MKASLPVLPSVIRVQLGKSGVDAQVIEDLLDRPEATASILKILETSEPGHAKRAVFWFLQSENSTEVGTDLNIEEIIKLSEMVEASELSSTAAKAVFAKVPGSNKGASELAKEMNLIQVSDESAIEKIVSEVLSENAQAAQDVKNGEMKAIGFLVGQVMAKSKGQANPGLTQQLIKKQLGI
jgi:aspartyl-tRNA(Asn)/glutamyl-tRNA(Gln) amidotransferase subunit B